MTNNHNPFDWLLTLFYWQPGSVSENNLTQLIDNWQSAAPNIRSVAIKTTTGLGWQGKYDRRKPNLAILGLADVQRWTEALARRGLECHAWCSVRGRVPGRELDRLAQLCQQSGVCSLLIDVGLSEPDHPSERRAHFVGDGHAAQALAMGLRERVGPDFHLGLIFDARGDRPRQVFVQSAWFPEIDSLHPLVFFRQFGQPAAQALADCHSALANWGKPVYPVLQAFDVTAAEVADAVTAALEQRRFAGLSLFRYGLGRGDGLNCDELAQVARRWPAALSTAHPKRASGRAHAGPAPSGAPTLVVVDPDDERSGSFVVGYYGDASVLQAGWTRDQDFNGRPRLYRNAAYNQQTLYVGYTPRLTGKGRYRIEAFIPRTHAYAPDVHYFVVDYPQGQRREVLAVLDQGPRDDVWVPLQGHVSGGPDAGAVVTEFDLDPAQPDAGRVNVADTTFEDPAQGPGGRYEISFGAMRWRPAAPEAGGFDSPVGADLERAGPLGGGRLLHDHYPIWCGNWYDANPRGTRYWLGNRWAVHTGADLNLEGPGGVLADKDAPVYAVADGRVISAGLVSSGWKNVIVIEHAVPGEERVVYARYAHVANMLVRANDVVVRGQPIAQIGQYAPNNYHLHFDLTYDPILKTMPGHWPGDNLDLVLRVYVDPLAFVQKRHVVR